jgi:hypothetical protein
MRATTRSGYAYQAPAVRERGIAGSMAERPVQSAQEKLEWLQDGLYTLKMTEERQAVRDLLKCSCQVLEGLE